MMAGDVRSATVVATLGSGGLGHPRLEPVDGGNADLQLPCGGIDGRAFVEEFPGLMLGESVEGRSAGLLGAAGEACPDTIPQDRALEFREYGEHGEHRAASGRGGVEALGMEVEIDAPAVDLGEEGHEVLEGAAEAIDGPACDEVDLLPRHHGHETIVGGAFVPALGSADPFIGQLLDDDPAHSFGDSIEFAALVLDGLGVGADAGVDGDALAHGADYTRGRGGFQFIVKGLCFIFWHRHGVGAEMMSKAVASHLLSLQYAAGC